MKEERRGRTVEARILQLCVFLFSITTSAAFYLISDYYMDPGTSSGMGGSCDTSVEDACFYVNSHIDVWGLFHYEPNVDCTMELNAGTMSGARFKIEWQWFWLQYPNNGDCSGQDYLAIYNADKASIANANLVGKYCGNKVDLTGYPTGQYLTLVFHTDGSVQKDGFRMRATRYEPLPCQDDEFECAGESICIDSRLKCDGTVQCADGTDEADCTFIEELLGTFFALGLGGMITVGVSTLVGCIGLWVIVGAFTCCRKCCSVCCNKCCFIWPCCKKCAGEPATFNKCCTTCCCCWPCFKGECGDPPNICDCCTTCWCFWPCCKGCGDPANCNECCAKMFPCLKDKCLKCGKREEEGCDWDDDDDLKKDKVQITVVDVDETTKKDKNGKTSGKEADKKGVEKPGAAAVVGGKTAATVTGKALEKEKTQVNDAAGKKADSNKATDKDGKAATGAVVAGAKTTDKDKTTAAATTDKNADKKTPAATATTVNVASKATENNKNDKDNKKATTTAATVPKTDDKDAAKSKTTDAGNKATPAAGGKTADKNAGKTVTSDSANKATSSTVASKPSTTNTATTSSTNKATTSTVANKTSTTTTATAVSTNKATTTSVTNKTTTAATTAVPASSKQTMVSGVGNGANTKSTIPDVK